MLLGGWRCCVLLYVSCLLWLFLLFPGCNGCGFAGCLDCRLWLVGYWCLVFYFDFGCWVGLCCLFVGCQWWVCFVCFGVVHMIVLFWVYFWVSVDFCALSLCWLVGCMVGDLCFRGRVVYDVSFAQIGVLLVYDLWLLVLDSVILVLLFGFGIGVAGYVYCAGVWGFGRFSGLCLRLVVVVLMGFVLLWVVLLFSWCGFEFWLTAG